MKLADLLSDAARKLARSDTPQLDAQVLLARVLRISRTRLLAHLDDEAQAEQARAFDSALRRLEAGEPLPYVLGEWEFFGLPFETTPDVLIPRPETELLVEKALAYLKTSARKRMADVGTGSGAIAVAVAFNAREARVLATDLSPAALEIAQRNAIKNGVQSQIQFVQCDLLPERASFPPFDLLCANLPYIPTETLRGLPVYGREPTLALDGGADGLSLFRRLFARVPPFLASEALLLLEIESTLGEESRRLAAEYFPRARVRLHQDLAGKDRLLEIWRKGG